MIRLKPSEIILTPADVEETRRRMERRQAANAAANAGIPLPSRTRQPPVPPGLKAHLRRGPARSRDDSVTTFADIPILRPQQAVCSSVEESVDPPRPARPARASFTGSSEAVSNEPTSSPFPSHQTTMGVTSFAARLSPTRTEDEVKLPFRPAAHKATSDPLVSTEESSEIDSPSPLKRHFSPSRVGRVRTNSSDQGNDEPTPSTYQPSTDGQIDNPTPPQTPMKHRPFSLCHGSVQISSPLQHVQRLSSSRHQGQAREEEATGTSPVRGEAGHQVVLGASPPLQSTRGYLDSHQQYKYVEHAPQTEPRPRTAQPLGHARAMSTSSEPAHQSHLRRPNSSNTPFVEDVFWSTPAPEHQINRNNGNDRNSTNISGRHSSDTSSNSQPYSFYELPDSSRHSSSTQSQPDPLAQSQYDGATPSHDLNHKLTRGAYYSIRLPASRATSRVYSRPISTRIPSTSSPDLGTIGQYGLSPMPARPYGRALSAQLPLLPSTGLISITDFVGGDQDAARAIQRDLSSPLDLIQERASIYLEQVSNRLQAAASQGRAADPRPPNIRNSEETNDRQRRTSGSGTFRHDPGNNLYGHASAQSRARMTFAPIPVPGSSPLDHAPHIHPRLSQVPRWPVTATRASHRSSENAPTGEAPDLRSTRLPTHRPNLVLRSNRPSSSIALRGGDLPMLHVLARFSIPHVPRPRDVSNRPHMHSPHPQIISSDNEPASDTLTPVPPITIRPNPLHGPRIPPRYASRQETHRTITPIPAPLWGLPSTSTTLDSARGETSWRHGARATRAPRIDAEQENSEERERQDLRVEMETVGWRAGREDVMEETPPRVGRYERFLFD